MGHTMEQQWGTYSTMVSSIVLLPILFYLTLMVALYKFRCVGHRFSASANGFRKDSTADHFRIFGFVLSSAIVRRTRALGLIKIIR